MFNERFRSYLPVVVDVETGGLKYETDALLEIAAIILCMDDSGFLEIDDKINYKVKPFENANIEHEALDFNGIDPFEENRGDVLESIAIGNIFRSVRNAVKREFCTKAIMVGHNTHFDLNFVNQAGFRCNIKHNPFHPFSCFDTVSLAGLAYGQTVLSKACKAANINFREDKAHSALYDAERTAELFCTIVNNWAKQKMRLSQH